ncbi:DUF2917 domain-containing protein [Paraburkholderia pallida]|uniref:DUF2917 domain-containing protein n=1 Tax=Paraburkholderia pallida TaxID=2547399 RepID=A0A4P7CMU8_9BURK|nr:DUF2917 domain-containing protein [Paraburkholderia pallida]QBQ97068.1 DUF2917 domain-containing protein [Paraburkholderia pallida]
MDRIMQAGEMRAQERCEELCIARGRCRLVRHAQGGLLGVLEGRVLMTVEGDAQDYWLEPGEALPFAPGERVWIGGWDEAVRCEVRTPASPWGEGRVLAWLVGLAALAVRMVKRPARVRLRALRG